MKRIYKVMLSIALIATIMCNSVALIAKSNVTFDIFYENKIKILTDGEPFEIPDTYTFSNGKEVSTELLKGYLKDKSNSSASVNYDEETSTLIIKGGLLSNNVSSIYAYAFDNYGRFSPDINETDIIKYTKKNFLMKKLQETVESQTEIYNQAEEGSAEKKTAKLIIDEYTADILEYGQIDLSVFEQNKKIVGSIPFLLSGSSMSASVNADRTEVTNDVKSSLYGISIIYRDLRLLDMKYEIDGTEYNITNFDKDTLTYDVALPATVADGTVVSTKSTSYSNSIQEDPKNADTAEYDMGITVEDTQVTINDKSAVAKVTVTFDASKYDDMDNRDKITKTYTINFKVSDFAKGDIDKNGKVNADDVTKVIDRFKADVWTQEDLDLADMDGDGKLNSDDAAKIVDVYKNS